MNSRYIPVIGTVDDVHQRLLDKVRYLDLELRAVSIGLKSKLEKTYLIRDQMSQCMEALPIGVILIDQEGQIQRVNKVARTLCGWEAHTCEGKSLENMWKQLGWPPAPFTNLPVDGAQLSCWEEVLGTPGTVPCLTARFLVDKERASDERQQFSREHCLKTLGGQVAKIAHDLRNSLASVELFASLVERRVCDDPEHQRVAPQLVRSIRSLEQLVNNLSTSANPRKPKMEMVAVKPLLDQIELLLAHQIQSRKIVVNRVIESEAEFILGDRVLLNQACLNIVNNAIAASEPGGVVNIDCRMTRPPSDEKQSPNGEPCVQIRVQDHGCGSIQKIFRTSVNRFIQKRIVGLVLDYRLSMM